MNPRKIAIHQSLHRHNLVMGAERELVMTSALIALLVGIGGMTWVSALCAGVFWIVAIFVLRRMARSDPLMSKIWLRSIKQQDYYSPLSSRWRPVGGFKVVKKS